MVIRIVPYSLSSDGTYRGLVRAVLAGECPLGILDDYREERGARRLRNGPAPVVQINEKSDRFRLLLDYVYRNRRDRAVNPEGEFDDAGRWYPSVREDADGDGSSTRGPSRAWPYSYMLRCRTRQHCAVLVRRALQGHDVPDDVREAVERRV